MKVTFSDAAKLDLGDILDFHNDRNPRYALELTGRLIGVELSVERRPQRGVPLRSRRGDYRRLFEAGHVRMLLKDLNPR